MEGTKSKIAVGIGVSSDLAFAACVTFLNIAKFNDTSKYTFYLFSDRNTEVLVAPLRKSGLEVRTIVYKPPVDWRKLWGCRSVAYFSPMVLSKFEALSLVEKHDLVIWLDYDVVILRSFEELEDIDTPFAFMEGSNLGESFTDPSVLDESVKHASGVSSELMVFRNTLLDSHVLKRKLYEEFESHFDNLRLPEQAIFGVVLRELNVQSTVLERSRFSPRTVNPYSPETPLMLHAAHAGKFWDGGQPDPRWEVHYSKWLDLGGQKFSGAKHLRVKTLRKVRYVFARLALLLSRIRQNKNVHDQ